jgi:hypothetical protein
MIDPAGSLPPGKRQANEQTNKQSNWRSSIKHRFHHRAAKDAENSPVKNNPDYP